MSKAAVEALLRAWDGSTNPIFHSAAGQMRQAISTVNARYTCERCGRQGQSRFVVRNVETVCWNESACDRRREGQGLS